jgi:hypothetical protein
LEYGTKSIVCEVKSSHLLLLRNLQDLTSDLARETPFCVGKLEDRERRELEEQS